MIKIDSNGKAFCLSCADEVEGVLVEREENCTNCSMQNTWDKFQKQLQTEKEFSNECLECVQPVRDCVCEDFDYEGTISFTTNKKLTPEQLDQLMDIIALQIIEPVDADQNDEDYSTRGVEVTVKEVE